MAIAYASNQAPISVSDTIFDAACTAGNAIIVFVSGYAASGTPDPSCSDPTNGSYERLFFHSTTYGTEKVWAAVFGKLNVAAVQVTPAMVDAASASITRLSREYSGFGTGTFATLVDQTASTDGASGQTDLLSGTAAGAIAQVDELLIGIANTDNGGVTPCTFTENHTGSVPSSGWVEAGEMSSLSPATAIATLINTSGTPTPIHHWLASQSSSGGAYVGILVTLKGGAVAGDTPVYQPWTQRASLLAQ